MKKLCLAFMAIAMTLSAYAQQMEDELSVVSENTENKKECIYSAETRAMMKVDRIASNLSDLKDGDRNKLVKHFTEQIEKIDASKIAGIPVDWDELRKENNEKMHKILGDKLYIEYLENMQGKLLSKIKQCRQKNKEHKTAKSEKVEK